MRLEVDAGCVLASDVDDQVEALLKFMWRTGELFEFSTPTGGDLGGLRR